jgi:hypothetical protein
MLSARARRLPSLIARVRGTLLLVVLLSGVVAPARAQTAVALEDVEAAYVLKFADYVHWPTHAFGDADAPLVIGVIDQAALVRRLVSLALGKQSHGRAVQVRQLQSSDRLDGVHILVLPPADDPGLARVVQSVAGLPILTVAPPQPDSGRVRTPAAIQLVLENDRLRFDVDLSAPNQGVRVGALMLTAARHVHRGVE